LVAAAAAAGLVSSLCFSIRRPVSKVMETFSAADHFLRKIRHLSRELQRSYVARGGKDARPIGNM
jgi:hypothetical protein